MSACRLAGVTEKMPVWQVPAIFFLPAGQKGSKSPLFPMLEKQQGQKNDAVFYCWRFVAQHGCV